MAATVADEAFELLYARYGGEIYRYALALLRNPAEAEDVTQTTFLNAYRALRNGAQPRRPHNWLIAIAHNACRSRVRFAMRRPKEVPLDDVVEHLAVPEAERPNIRELLRTIRGLPFNQRAAITMRELQGCSYVDIAETLGVTVPAAEALIGRARRTLRSRAAAFRSLLLVPLPRSLRKLAGNGDAAGGAAGAAAGAKIAALLVAGAIGGGVGVAAGTGSEARLSPAEPAVAAVVQRRVESNTPAPPTPSHAMPVRRSDAAAAPRPQIAVTEPAAPASTAAAPAQAPPAASTPTETVSTTVDSTVARLTQAITTVASQLPTVTTPAATTPPATTPALTTPVATVPPVTVPAVTAPSVTVPPLP